MAQYIIPFQSAAVKKRKKKKQYVLPYLIITSAPAGGSSESIFVCVLASVKSHLDKIVAPRMSSMSNIKKDKICNLGHQVIWFKKKF